MVMQKELVKRAVKHAEEQAPKPEDGTSEQVMDPLAELVGRAHSAYAAYADAQKQVARAYKERDQQLEKAYKQAEQQADSTYEETIEQALRDREKAEQQAEKVFEKAREKVMEA